MKKLIQIFVCVGALLLLTGCPGGGNDGVGGGGGQELLQLISKKVGRTVTGEDLHSVQDKIDKTKVRTECVENPIKKSLIDDLNKKYGKDVTLDDLENLHMTNDSLSEKEYREFVSKVVKVYSSLTSINYSEMESYLETEGEDSFRLKELMEGVLECIAEEFAKLLR